MPLLGKTKDLTKKKDDKEKAKEITDEVKNDTETEIDARKARLKELETEIDARKARLKELKEECMFFENETAKKQQDFKTMLEHHESERVMFEIMQQLPVVMPENLKEIHAYIIDSLRGTEK